MGYVTGDDRRQPCLLPAVIDDYVDPNAPVRVIDVFVDGLDFSALGFERAAPASTGRPGYDPRDLLKLYIYGYLNEVRSSRRLERECKRNVEVMWLVGRLAPDHKTIADFRRDNGAAIVGGCRAFVLFAASKGFSLPYLYRSTVQRFVPRPVLSECSISVESPRKLRRSTPRSRATSPSLTKRTRSIMAITARPPRRRSRR